MVDCMAAPPVIVGGHRHNADPPADPLVGGFARQERAVPAIVLDHEEVNQQHGRQRRHGERKPDLAMTGGDEHSGPEREERQNGDRKLEDAARRACPAVGDERLRPVRAAFGAPCISTVDISRPLPDTRFNESVAERVVDCARGRIEQGAPDAPAGSAVLREQLRPA